MLLRSDRIAGGLLAALGVATLAEALLRLPLGSLADPGPGYAPVILGALLAALGAIITGSGAESPPLGARGWAELPHAARVTGGVVFAVLALEPLGYRLTTLALLLFFLGVVERRSLAATLSVAVAFSFLSHYLFATLLRVPLPTGPWGI